MTKLEVNEKEQVWAALSTPPDLRPNPSYGDLMTADEFVEMCRCGAFISDDGSGNWATATHCDSRRDISIRKLVTGIDKKPNWATHVMWFNK